VARNCTICRHAKRHEIDRALVEGVPTLQVADQYKLARSSVRRHQASHLGEKMAKAAKSREVREVVEAVKLVVVAREMLAKLQSLANDAEKDKDIRGAVSAIGKIPDFLRILGEIEGRLQSHGTVNVTVMPEWSAIRTTILSALQPFPDAADAVALALEHVPAAGNA
jgi:hypothetical protein